MKLEAFREEYQEAILEECRSNFKSGATKLHAAMNYALSTGGKHVRPLLTVAFTKALGGDINIGLRVAPAIEFVHTYSLIHDDLPAMDNDDYRRGELTVHKKFDEATAILAGDALLTYAFQYLAQLPDIDAQTKVFLIQMLASAAGDDGMVEGQMRDIAAEGADITLDDLQVLHQQKTGRLLTYSILSAALISNVSESIRDDCLVFATHYGIAYQIQNDLQEVVWSEEQRGKKSHSDLELEKNTYPAIIGVEESKEALTEQIHHCRHCLNAIQEEDPTFDRELIAGFLDYLAL